MSIHKWFWKRYIRIIIPCALFIVPLTILEYFKSSSSAIGIGGILLYLSGFGYLFDKGALWFVTCILLLYLITPLIHKLLTIPLFRFWNFDIWGIDLNMGRWSFYIVGTLICLFLSYTVNKFSKYIITQIS